MNSQIFRRLAQKWLMVLTAINVAIAVAVLMAKPLLMTVIRAGASAGLCLAAQGRIQSETGRAVAAFCLLGQVAVIVATLNGHALQVDAHM